MAPVGLIKDDIFMNHITSDFHPEHPERLKAIYSLLEDKKIQQQSSVLQAREALPQELAWIHTESYIQKIESTKGCRHQQLDPDTAVSAETYRIAKLAAGGLFVLIDALYNEQISSGFALIRPPGHHAEADRGMGFCIYNNVAIAARYAQQKGYAKKILIIDWDLHHGNGTQHSFESDPTVLYFSSHQFPYYPGTGRVEEVGRGEGKGFTVNVPLPGGQGDGDFIEIYQKTIVPIADQFQPDLLLISAGFDTYNRDPLGGMDVTESGFAQLARLLKQVADTHCQGRILLTLEGGYHTGGLARSVKEVIHALYGEQAEETADLSPASDTAKQIIDYVQKVQGTYWQF